MNEKKNEQEDIKRENMACNVLIIFSLLSSLCVFPFSDFFIVVLRPLDKCLLYCIDHVFLLNSDALMVAK